MHLVPGSPLFDEWAGRSGAQNTLDGLLREMEENEVERAALFGHWVGHEGPQDGPFRNGPNNTLVQAVEREKGRLVALLSVNVAPMGIPDLDALETWLARPGFVGVKFFTGYETYAADDPRLEPVFEILERRKSVAVFHTGDTLLPSGHLRFAHPLAADKVAVAHPDLTIVLAHAGQHWMPDAGEVVGKNPNVWADISGWFVGRPDLPPHADFLKGQFRELIYWATGCDRLMFGSDWPLMRVRPYLEFMERCSEFLTKQERRAILYDNAKRLYWR